MADVAVQRLVVDSDAFCGIMGAIDEVSDTPEDRFPPSGMSSLNDTIGGFLRFWIVGITADEELEALGMFL